MTGMRRRDVLIAGLVGLGMALVGCDDDAEPTAAVPDAAVPPETNLPPEWSALQAKLDAWFEGAPDAAVFAIGRAYLAGFADGPAVVADLGPLAVTLAALADAAAVREAMVQAIDDDFGAVRLAGVQGWQLSVTEVRLCGLAERLAQETAAM